MLDLSPLWKRAFLEGEAREANQRLMDARAAFVALAPGKAGGDPFSYEVVVPPEPELAWLADTLLPPFIYHCETRRAPLPECGAVFVSAFVGERLFCVAAAEVIAFAADLLKQSWEELVELHGTGEVRHPVQREGADAVKGLLPGRRS